MTTVKKLWLYLLALSLMTMATWGVIAFKQIPLKTVLSSPWIILFLLGGFTPVLAAAVLGKEGLSDLKKQAFAKPAKEYLPVIPLFLVIHFGLHALRGFEYTLPFAEMAPYAILLFLIGAVQEIAWVNVLQPVLETRSGFTKSLVASGCVRGLWILPVIAIPGVPALPTAYIYLVAAIIGIHAMSYAIRTTTDSAMMSMLFNGLLLILTPMLQAKQNGYLVLWAVIEVVLVYLLMKYHTERMKVKAQRERFNA